MSREAAHARNPYSGDRRLLVALGEPTTHGEVPIEGELYVGTI
jgi:hypothetical protein